jgi:hypothetical protein
LGLLSIRWHRLGVGDPADPCRHRKGVAERVRNSAFGRHQPIVLINLGGPHLYLETGG